MKDSDFPSVKQLLEAGAHFGHVIKRWNPKMDKYIYDGRNGIHLFDLFITREKLVEACEYLEEAVATGKTVAFVGTKGQAVELLKSEAVRLGIPYVVNRWVGGTLTNWDEIKKRIDTLASMREKMEKGEYDKYTKKEKVVIKRDIERLERMYGGIADLKTIPDILFVVDPNRENTAVREAMGKGLTIVALADTNADPDDVDYIIPANDDALKSVKLVIMSVVKAVEAGQKKMKKGTTKKEDKKAKAVK